MDQKSDIKLQIFEQIIYPNEEIHGKIELNYDGRFDSVVINSQIENSNDIFNYIELNGKKINHPYARLSIFRKELGDRNTIEFTAITKHIPSTSSGFSRVKFRTSIIQEHKEIANYIFFRDIKKEKTV
ncbi:MAG TPA: hypothetical protein VJ767_00230 [Nitrososphaeraceae archaeon]|nr:hypothetical protein [Nitrososphaeraceae archaeon]